MRNNISSPKRSWYKKVQNQDINITTISVSSHLTMQCVYFLVVVAALAVAEPPSHSYLPPPPSSRNNGYAQRNPEALGSQGAQGTAVRSEQENSVNVFARANPNEYHGAARIPSQSYDDNTANFAKNSVEGVSEPANYNFGYMVNDFSEGTDFGHREERIEEKAQGQYHVVLPDGRKQTVNYEADERGFKPQISYEDSEELARSSGYSSNARFQGNYKNGGQDARGY